MAVITGNQETPRRSRLHRLPVDVVQVKLDLPDSVRKSDEAQPNEEKPIVIDKSSTYYDTAAINPEGVDFLVEQGLDIKRLGFKSIKAAKKVEFKKVVLPLSALVRHHDRKLSARISSHISARGYVYKKSLLNAIEHAQKDDVAIIGSWAKASGTIYYRFSGDYEKFSVCEPSPEGVDFLEARGLSVTRYLGYHSIKEAKAVPFEDVVKRLRALVFKNDFPLYARMKMMINSEKKILVKHLLDAMAIATSGNQQITGCYVRKNGAKVYNIKQIAGVEPTETGRAGNCQPHLLPH